MRFRLSRRVVIWLALPLVVAAVVLLLLPAVVRRVAVQQLEARFAAAVRIDDVDLNVFTGRMRVLNVIVGDKDGGGPILRLPSIEFRVSRRALLRGEIVLGDLAFHQPRLAIERTDSGQFNVVEVFRAQRKNGEAGGGFVIADLKIQGGGITYIDRSTSPAVNLELRDLRVRLQGLAFAPGAEPGRIEAEARLGNGTLRVAGTLRIWPLDSRFTLSAANVPLERFQGYVETVLGTAGAREGSVDGDLEIALTSGQEDGVSLKVNGAVQGRDLAVWMADEKKPFLSAQQVVIDIARMDILPSFHADLPEVKLDAATLRLARDAEGRLNLQRLWASPHGQGATIPPEEASPRVQGAPSPVAIRRIYIAGGQIDFVDAAVSPAFTATISQLSAELRQEPQRPDRATVTLEGILGDSGQLKLSGWITPFTRPLRLNLEGAIRDYEVARLNPYAEKIIRYQVRRGRVSTKGSYRYDAGNLAADNTFTLGQVDLGEQLGTDFEERVGIPIKLALALLEDADGEIRLDVPVKGKVDSPEFSFDAVVWKAVQNAVLKALTVPLRLVGTILTVGGKIGAVNIDPVEFLPGSLELGTGGGERLEELIQVLRERPRLKLELQGRATAQESEPLRRRLLREQIEAVRGATYEQAVTRLYLAAGGRETKESPIEPGTKERYLLERIVVTEQHLRQLAEDRARVIEKSLLQEEIKPSRLFLVSKDDAAVIDRPPGRVEFDLLY